MRRWGNIVLVAGIVIASASAVTLRIGQRVTRQLESVTTDERARLYRSTLDTLKTTCARPTWPTLIEHCRDEARFIEQLPECDDACRALASRFPMATR